MVGAEMDDDYGASGFIWHNALPAVNLYRESRNSGKNSDQRQAADHCYYSVDTGSIFGGIRYRGIIKIDN
jgi:hypothetical protein